MIYMKETSQISKINTEKKGFSNTSSIIESNSMLNTEEEKSPENVIDQSKINRYEFYAKYKNPEQIQEGKIGCHKYELEKRYNIKQFSQFFIVRINI